MKFKAISIKQPWPALIMLKMKWFETRTWVTKHRGPLVIVSSLKPDLVAMRSLYERPEIYEACEPYMLYGKALGICELVDCRDMMPSDEKGAMCPIYENAKVWHLDTVVPFENPFDVKGQQGLYEVQLPAA